MKFYVTVARKIEIVIYAVQSERDALVDDQHGAIFDAKVCAGRIAAEGFDIAIDFKVLRPSGPRGRRRHRRQRHKSFEYLFDHSVKILFVLLLILFPFLPFAAESINPFLGDLWIAVGDGGVFRACRCFRAR